MRKVEEFNKTQMLMDEFNEIKSRGPEIENEIEDTIANLVDFKSITQLKH